MCQVWFDQVTDGTTGRHGYSKRGEPSSRHPGDHATRFPANKGECLTAVGLLCRFFLKQDPEKSPIMKLSADTLLAKPPVWNTKDGSIDHYYWYYATYALYQMGKRHWKTWSKHLTKAVVKNEDTGDELTVRDMPASPSKDCPSYSSTSRPCAHARSRARA